MRIIAAAIAFLNAITLFAQRPTHVPGPQGPVRFFESPANIVIYIVLPLAIIVFYMIWRRQKNKNQQE